MTPSSCHGESSYRSATIGSPVVAFIGAPNVGKSTLYNLLTGSRRQTGNWPGTTVEIGRGTWRTRHGRELDAIDFPGTYSLDPQSPDEALTRELVIDCTPDDRPDLVVVVADATNLARSGYLIAQLREVPLRLVVVLTMLDVAATRGLTIDAKRLADGFGCEVVAVDPRMIRPRKQGASTPHDELEHAIERALALPPLSPRNSDCGVEDEGDEFALVDDRFAWVDAAITPALHQATTMRRSATEAADRVLLHPIFGPLIFFGVMWVVFQITTTVAAPIQGWLDALISGPITVGAESLFGALRLDGTILADLVINGVIAGVGMVLTFVPLMALMFVLLSLLEDSGYLARAAVVVDRAMAAIGLPGRAFLPLIVGFGCNVPAITATRVLGSARERIMTCLLIPFTSCSARLTVYVMVASTFFPANAGTVVFVMYLVSIALVIGVGLLLRSTLWRKVGREPLLLDLPTFHVPQPRLIVSATWMRLRGFLQTAGTIILLTVVAVWALQSTPAPGQQSSFGQVAVADSVYAATAGVVAPALAPAGLDDWHTAGALMTGFVAKETVVSSWAQTYSLDDPSVLSTEDQGHSPLGLALRDTFTASSGGHPIAAAWAFLIFLLAYTPCVSTLAVQVREMGWRWTGFGVALQVGIAWLLATGVFQLLRLWW